jgi:hypothetical protein
VVKQLLANGGRSAKSMTIVTLADALAHRSANREQRVAPGDVAGASRSAPAGHGDQMTVPVQRPIHTVGWNSGIGSGVNTGVPGCQNERKARFSPVL